MLRTGSPANTLISSDHCIVKGETLHCTRASLLDLESFEETRWSNHVAKAGNTIPTSTTANNIAAVANTTATNTSSFTPFTAMAESGAAAGKRTKKRGSGTVATPPPASNLFAPPTFSLDTVSPPKFFFGVASKSQMKANSTLTAVTTNGDPFVNEVTEFESLRKEHIRPLIELNDSVNALISSETQINSTQIVVAGDQSHGKTSLLEALSGVDLPRGAGIVTRVPLILQLRGCKANEPEYALIQEDHNSSTKTNEERIGLQQIRQKVVEYTERVAGAGKDVQNKPIRLKIFRKEQDDLTLVDLQGITRVALDDQAGGDGQKLEKLILGMCREYMKPEESILLNVVSAMVDFSTSASLALSRKLDPKGSRTMLCVTKVDQHSEDGFHEKVTKAIESMKLKPQHVFCVRNRSQKENKRGMPLHEVRALEKKLLQNLTKDKVFEYQLGVQSLSKTLVKRQFEEILRTLPGTQQKIKNKSDALNSELKHLGDPVGDTKTCRGKATQLVDACMTRMQDGLSGRLPPETDTAVTTCEGEAFELSLPLPNLKQFLKDEAPKGIHSDKFTVGECRFCIFLQSNNEGDKQNLGAYLWVKTSNESIQGVHVVCNFMASSTGEPAIRDSEMEHTYDQGGLRAGTGRGFEGFLSSDRLENLQDVTVACNVFVEKITLQEHVGPNIESSLLCSRLADLHDEFTTDVDKLYSNHYFFSTAFRKSLAREVSATRGGIGLPGTVSPHISAGALQKLSGKLHIPINTFRTKVFGECKRTTEAIIDKYVDHAVFPRLHCLLVEETHELIGTKNKKLESRHKEILEWQSVMATTNHYFMGTVQSIRSRLFNSNSDDDEPAEDDYDYDCSTHEQLSYLGKLTPSVIRQMSNEEQKLVDEQIAIFAYWKVLKKVLVDIVIQSTQFELVADPINKKLKPLLLDAIFSRHDDEQLVKLLSPEDAVVEKRASLEEQLGKLQEALNKIVAHQSKHRGGIVVI